MKKILFLVLLQAGLASPAQDMPRVRATIDTLTSSDLAGRGYVNNGNRKAADLIARRFRQAGLVPFGENYFQPLGFDVNVFPGKASLKINGKSLVAGQDFIASPISGKGRGKAAILPLDTAIFTDEPARQHFLSLDLKHKAVLYQAKFYAALIQLPAPYLAHLGQAQALLEIQDKKLTASVAGVQQLHPAFQILKASLPLICFNNCL